jgi:hypothetical protein
VAAASALLHACRTEDAIESTAVVPASLPPTTDVDEDSQTPEPGGSPTTGSETATAPVTPATVSATALVGGINLEQFMRMSQVVTNFADLNDTSNGATYLAALNRQPELGTALGDLWEQGGFADGQPASVADLEAAGVYDDATLAELAETPSRATGTPASTTAAPARWRSRRSPSRSPGARSVTAKPTQPPARGLWELGGRAGRLSRCESTQSERTARQRT